MKIKIPNPSYWIPYAWEFVYAFFANLYIEWHNNRLENKRRRWTAVKTGGGGIVPLGKVSQAEAIAKTTKFGSIDFVDSEVAVIMFSNTFNAL